MQTAHVILLCRNIRGPDCIPTIPSNLVFAQCHRRHREDSCSANVATCHLLVTAQPPRVSPLHLSYQNTRSRASPRRKKIFNSNWLTGSLRNSALNYAAPATPPESSQHRLDCWPAGPCSLAMKGIPLVVMAMLALH